MHHQDDKSDNNNNIKGYVIVSDSQESSSREVKKSFVVSLSTPPESEGVELSLWASQGKPASKLSHPHSSQTVVEVASRACKQQTALH
jgi:hypothetical protein